MKSDTSERSPVLTVALAVIIGVALAGFFVGIRPLPESAPPAAAASESDGAAPQVSVQPAKSYTELWETDRGPNAGGFSDLATLRKNAPEAPGTAPGMEAKLASLEARSDNRAYDGAPPTVPHAIDPRDASSCLTCHGEGVTMAGRTASPIPHPPYANCTQCHAPDGGPRWADEPTSTDNSFVGLAAPTGGPKAHPAAPPQIPHPTRMRSDCGSCHGPYGAPGLRSTHSDDRRSCTQCHAPSAQEDRRDWFDQVEM
ncbi:MAG: cytochrome c3 family protein [Myxococcota bacterium]